MKSLSSERWRQIDAVFAEALERAPADRAAFLDGRCGDDAELRAEVDALLRALDEAEDALGESVTDFAEPLMEDLRATLEREEMEVLPGEGRIGPYRLLRMIGRGGMGAVYLADRADDQFEQRVALKLVKRGMDTDDVLQRFRYERQILAALEHPNIGRLYDGGAAEDGRPYLVMEHIEGEPVTAYCDARRLSIDERLQLFETICGAVQFAHRNLVIHRDIKPSNILVTQDGTVKLLDFGIAKLLDPAHAEMAPQTQTEMRLLTPEYASPEQLRGDAVTTASDVYALGVVLFELLTGRRPGGHGGGRARGRTGAADTGAVRPSSTLVKSLLPAGEKESRASAVETAERRGTTPERLRLRLKGDLDTITLKALADEPERRYHSAEQLLADVQRHRRGLPVLARGDSFGYRAAKFVRRHRLVVSFSAALTVLLLGFASTTFVQNRLLEDAREAQALRQGQAEVLIGYMLGSLRSQLEPIGQLSILEDAANKAAEYFMAVPPERLSGEELFRRTEQMRFLGEVRSGLGDNAEALASFDDAYALSEELLHRDSANLSWRLGLATSHYWLGYMAYRQGDLPTALEHFDGYRDLASTLVAMAPDSLTYQLELSYAHGSVGTVLEQMGDSEGALREFLLTLEQKKKLAETEPDNVEFQTALAIAYNKVAGAEQARGSLPIAREHYQAEIAVRQALVDRRPNDMPARRSLSLAHSFLGELLVATGDDAGGLEHRLAAWRIQQELARWDAANVDWQRGLAISARLAGFGLVASDRQEEGLAALLQSREILQRLLEREPASADYKQELARTEIAIAAANRRSRPEEALVAVQGALDIIASLREASDDGSAAESIQSEAYLELGRVLAQSGRAAEARAAWTEALEVPGSADASSLDRLAMRGAALLYLGRVAEARPIVEDLVRRGYQQSDFLALARSSGLNVLSVP